MSASLSSLGDRMSDPTMYTPDIKFINPAEQEAYIQGFKAFDGKVQRPPPNPYDPQAHPNLAFAWELGYKEYRSSYLDTTIKENGEYDIGRADAILALRKCKTRWRVEDSEWGSKTIVEIFYKGKWREVGQCDAADQVRRNIGSSSHELWKTNPIKVYEERCIFGARITETDFFVIDSLTDG